MVSEQQFRTLFPEFVPDDVDVQRRYYVPAFGLGLPRRCSLGGRMRVFIVLRFVDRRANRIFRERRLNRRRVLIDVRNSLAKSC